LATIEKDTVEKMMKRKMSGILTLVLALSVMMLGTACSKGSAGMTPTAVFKAYYDAAMKKDFTTAKKYLSKGSVALMEAGAKQQGKTLEEAMSSEGGAAQGPMPQLSNEKITGDTATVDISAEGQKMAMPFIKENGEWKIAMDKLAMGMVEGQKAPPAAQSTPLAPSTPSTQNTPSAEKDDDDDNDNANH
jgi:hypothetical protein